jgi:hypothetical protein
MWALLQDGPFANQHYAVEDPAPETITLEAMPTGDDLLVPIPPGGEFPTAHFERRAYRLMGMDRTLSPAPNQDHRLPVYVHAPELEVAA